MKLLDAPSCRGAANVGLALVGAEVVPQSDTGGDAIEASDPNPPVGLIAELEQQGPEVMYETSQGSRAPSGSAVGA